MEFEEGEEKAPGGGGGGPLLGVLLTTASSKHGGPLGTERVSTSFGVSDSAPYETFSRLGKRGVVFRQRYGLFTLSSSFTVTRHACVWCLPPSPLTFSFLNNGKYFQPKALISSNGKIVLYLIGDLKNIINN